MKGYMYILRCADGSYYVGSTTNLEKRLAQHQAGKGANHTKKRLPVELVYFEEYSRIDKAFYREKQVQGWSRKKKEALIANKPEKLHFLSECKNDTHYSKRWFRLRSTTVGESTVGESTVGENTVSSTTVSENTVGSTTVGENAVDKNTVDENTVGETAGIKNILGNAELLKLPKTAFLCSRKVPASVVPKCYEWAIEQREKDNCIISGFHSKLEKDVLHYLLKGKQPIIIALARGLQEKMDPELIKPLDEGRLLIISPFNKSVKRVTERTAEIRNKMMIELADNITVGYASAGGKLESLLKTTKKDVIKLL